MKKDKHKPFSTYQVERQVSYCVCTEVQTEGEIARKAPGNQG